MTDVAEIRAVVRGTVTYPGAPEHVGAWGLVDREDVTATRRTFRSVGEAMTWARKVLDGEVSARWAPAGEPPGETAVSRPRWESAHVIWSEPGQPDEQWSATTSNRDWHEVVTIDGADIPGALARSDPHPGKTIPGPEQATALKETA